MDRSQRERAEWEYSPEPNTPTADLSKVSREEWLSNPWIKDSPYNPYKDELPR